MFWRIFGVVLILWSIYMYFWGFKNLGISGDVPLPFPQV